MAEVMATVTEEAMVTEETTAMAGAMVMAEAMATAKDLDFVITTVFITVNSSL